MNAYDAIPSPPKNNPAIDTWIEVDSSTVYIPLFQNGQGWQHCAVDHSHQEWPGPGTFCLGSDELIRLDGLVDSLIQLDDYDIVI